MIRILRKIIQELAENLPKYLDDFLIPFIIKSNLWWQRNDWAWQGLLAISLIIGIIITYKVLKDRNLSLTDLKSKS